MTQTDAVITVKVADLDAMKETLAIAVAAHQELALLKPVLAFAISKLPKQQLKLTLTEQATIGELALQMKHEGKSGAILFRAVKA